MPTNQEWLHKLANESPDELKAWFDAEHSDNLAAEKVVSCDAAHSNDANAHLKASEDLSDAFSDSREQLEADVREWVDDIGWLSDKETQVADFIAWLDRQAAITANANKELIEWQAATVARLQKEVDRLQRRNDELRTSYDKLKRERDNLADDLLACNREREQLRKHLGIALDHAHDICSLVDIDGNVLDVGD